jgi:hypothetical protein
MGAAVADGRLDEVRSLAVDLARSTEHVLSCVRDARQELGVEPLIGFVHIPKTAGGTVTNMLVAAYSKAGVRPVGNYFRGADRTVEKISRETGGWESWQRTGGRVAVGHVPYGLFRTHLPPDTRYMTFLRDPVDRVLSHYHRHIHQPNADRDKRRHGEQGRKATATSIEQALLELHLPEMNNLATRLLCSDPAPTGELSAAAVDDAKENLSNFEFVGIQERFEESLVLLQRMLGLERVPYVSRHVSSEGRRGTVEDISAEQRALILECNRLDADLYAFGLELFERAAASAGSGLATEAAELRALSEARNDDATRRALDWLDSTFPVGTSKSREELFSEARAAGISPLLVKQLLRDRARRERKNGKPVYTRTGDAADRRVNS